MEVKDWRDSIHPGEILRDELETMGMTPFILARHLHIPNNRLYQILDGRRQPSGESRANGPRPALALAVDGGVGAVILRFTLRGHADYGRGQCLLAPTLPNLCHHLPRHFH